MSPNPTSVISVQVPAHSHQRPRLWKGRRATKLKSSSLVASLRHLRLLAPALSASWRTDPMACIPSHLARGCLQSPPRGCCRWGWGGGSEERAGPGGRASRGRARSAPGGGGPAPRVVGLRTERGQSPLTHRGPLRGHGKCLGGDAGRHGSGAVALARSLVLRLLKLAMGRTPARETPAIGCH